MIWVYILVPILTGVLAGWLFWEDGGKCYTESFDDGVKKVVEEEKHCQHCRWTAAAFGLVIGILTGMFFFNGIIYLIEMLARSVFGS